MKLPCTTDHWCMETHSCSSGISFILQARTQTALLLLISAQMSAGWSAEDGNTFWSQRSCHSLLQHPVTERRVRQLEERRDERHVNLENRRDTFTRQHHLQDADGETIIDTDEAQNLAFWVRLQSWTYCSKCSKLEPRKLQPSFALKTATHLDPTCKCGALMATDNALDHSESLGAQCW